MARKKTRHCDWRLPAAEMCAECLELRRKHSRELNKTPQGRESVRRYAESPKGRARTRRYAESPKGRESVRRYKKTAKGRDLARRYAETPQGIEARRKARHKYYLNVTKPAREAARRWTTP